jgi:hypothetical protein
VAGLGFVFQSFSQQLRQIPLHQMLPSVKVYHGMRTMKETLMAGLGKIFDEFVEHLHATYSTSIACSYVIRAYVEQQWKKRRNVSNAHPV